jgi:hypothetical protein
MEPDYTDSITKITKMNDPMFKCKCPCLCLSKLLVTTSILTGYCANCRIGNCRGKGLIPNITKSGNYEVKKKEAV